MNNEGETMTTEEIPERQKPAIRKSTVIQDSSATPRARKTAVKKDVVKKRAGEKPAESKKKKRGSLKVILLMILSALISSGSTYAVINNINNTVAASPATPTSTFAEVIAGKVALTEAELIAAVKQLGVDVYWAGPVNGAKYTLAVPADGQAYVRYLPEGQGIEDTKPNYVVIATYTTTDAFNSTQAAGNTSNGVSFISAAGAAIYYSKDNPTNVYVAYPNLNYQIEIFNPIAATALEIASTSGALKLVR